MDGVSRAGGWVRPLVRDYGDLVKLTGDAMLHLGIAGPSLMAVSSATVPGGGAGGVAGAAAGTTGGDDLAAELPASANSPGSGNDSGDVAGIAPAAGGTGSGGSGRGGAGGGGDLPFTGLVLGVLGAAGAGLSAAGATLRRRLRRKS